MATLGATILNDIPPGSLKGETKSKDASSKDDLKPPRITRSTRKPDLTPALMQVYVMIGAGLAAFPATQDDAAVIFANAESAAKSVAKLADEKPEVYKAIQKFLTASSYAGVIAAHLPIVIGIAGNHGLKIPMPFASDNDDDDNSE